MTVGPDTQNCPECGALWRSDPIPEAQREAFGGRTHFSRLIAIYDTTRDRVGAWRCPDCHKDWSRDEPQDD